MINYKQYLDEKIHQLKVVCRSQWDYLNYSNLCAWLEDNFNGDIQGKYYAIKILLHTVYYKKIDIEKLIKYGLFEKIYGEIIKEKLIADKNIYIDSSKGSAAVNSLKNESFFIPLLDSMKPSESGNIFTGDLVHKFNINPSQIDFHWNVTEDKLNGKKLLIFVDDCVGSGAQLKKFWNSIAIQNLKIICQKLDIKIYYLVLLGYDKNLDELKFENKLLGIEIVVCDVLTDKNRVFSDDNIIWDKNTNEREEAIKYFENIKKTRGVSFLGYTRLDFAVILHDRLPDWTLPIFWKKTVGWKNLIQRKTSET